MGEGLVFPVATAVGFGVVGRYRRTVGLRRGQDAEDAAGAARPSVSAGAAGRGFVDEDFVALHAPLSSLGGDEQVVFPGGGAVGADEAEAVAVEVELAGDEVFRG